MYKKFILILVGFIFLFSFKLVNASIIINEVQISPTAERFVELYNTGSGDIDLTNWYLQRKTATGSDFSSLVSKTFFEGKSIGGNSYFVISKDSLGLTSFTLTESNVIQLKNSAQEIVDKIGWGSVDSSVVGNPVEGKSIQKTGGNWIIASPTSGKNNNTVADTYFNEADNPDDDSLSNTNGQINTDETFIKNKTVPSIKAKILTKSVSFVGVPLEIGSNILGYKNETILPGKYFWNFGDGTSLSTTNPVKFLHTYFYPGEYNISLEYYLRPSSQVSDALDHFALKVEPLSISISRVGDTQDFFVELTNNSNNEIDISNWILNTTLKNFIFPKNSFIGPNKKIIVSSRITGFVFGDKNNLKLISPTGEIIFVYNSSPTQNKIVYQNSNTAIDQNIQEIKNNIGNIQEQNDIQDYKNNLPASALLSDVQNKSNSNNHLFFGMFFALILGATTCVYFIRRKKNIFKKDGDDFEILDE